MPPLQTARAKTMSSLNKRFRLSHPILGLLTCQLAVAVAMDCGPLKLVALGVILL